MNLSFVFLLLGVLLLIGALGCVLAGGLGLLFASLIAPEFDERVAFWLPGAVGGVLAVASPVLALYRATPRRR